MNWNNTNGVVTNKIDKKGNYTVGGGSIVVKKKRNKKGKKKRKGQKLGQGNGFKNQQTPFGGFQTISSNQQNQQFNQQNQIKLNQKVKKKL